MSDIELFISFPTSPAPAYSSFRLPMEYMIPLLTQPLNPQTQESSLALQSTPNASVGLANCTFKIKSAMDFFLPFPLLSLKPKLLFSLFWVTAAPAHSSSPALGQSDVLKTET